MIPCHSNLTGQLYCPVSRRHYTLAEDSMQYCLGHRICTNMRDRWCHWITCDLIYYTIHQSVLFSERPSASASQTDSFQTGLRLPVHKRMLVIHCNIKVNFLHSRTRKIEFCERHQQLRHVLHFKSGRKPVCISRCFMRLLWPWWLAQRKEDSRQSGVASFSNTSLII